MGSGKESAKEELLAIAIKFTCASGNLLTSEIHVIDDAFEKAISLNDHRPYRNKIILQVPPSHTSPVFW